MLPNLVNEHELSGLIKISTSTLRKWRWEGKGPKFIKMGRRVVYRMSDVEEFIDDCTTRSTSAMGIQ